MLSRYTLILNTVIRSIYQYIYIQQTDVTVYTYVKSYGLLHLRTCYVTHLKA